MFPAKEVVPHAPRPLLCPRIHSLLLIVEQEGAVLARVEMVQQASQEALAKLKACWVLVMQLVDTVKKLVEDR